MHQIREEMSEVVMYQILDKMQGMAEPGPESTTSFRPLYMTKGRAI